MEQIALDYEKIQDIYYPCPVRRSKTAFNELQPLMAFNDVKRHLWTLRGCLTSVIWLLFIGDCHAKYQKLFELSNQFANES